VSHTGRATAIHSITDGDVAHEPSFAQLARGLVDFLDGCDLCGFNLRGYDLRVLCAEFRRACVPFSLDGRAVIDPMRIFHACERRDLSAAVQFYLGRNHGRAHSAEADVLATAEVLDLPT
jgi:DNA polymerase III subunit epsilon